MDSHKVNGRRRRRLVTELMGLFLEMLGGDIRGLGRRWGHVPWPFPCAASRFVIRTYPIRLSIQHGHAQIPITSPQACDAVGRKSGILAIREWNVTEKLHRKNSNALESRESAALAHRVTCPTVAKSNLG